jgi:group I intron endonuclease
MIEIYLITNTKNNKTYVGQTERGFQQRFKEHCNSGRSGIGKAIQKYKPESFTIKLLETTTIEEANTRETYWIKETNSYRGGYNLCEVGDSSQNSKQPEVRRKIGEAAKRRVEEGKWVSPTAGGHTEEAKAKMRGPRPDANKRHIGMKRSEETRKRISESTKGKRIGNQNAGRKVVVEGVEYPSVKAAAREYGIQPATLRRRYGL